MSDTPEKQNASTLKAVLTFKFRR